MLSWLRHRTPKGHPYARSIDMYSTVCPEFDDIDGTLALVSEGIRADGFYRPSDLELPGFNNGLDQWILEPTAQRRRRIVFLLRRGISVSEIDTGLGLEEGTALRILREIGGG